MLVWGLTTIIVVLSLMVAGMIWFIYRGVSRMNDTDNILENLSYNLSTLLTMCNEVHSNEIYSNDPMIIAFIDQIKSTSKILESYDPYFTITEVELKLPEQEDES